MEKVKFFTLGCKVNQYETQAIREQFLKAGYQEDDNGRADIYVINTCTVTARADQQSRQLINQTLKASPRAKIIATGCYVAKDRAQIQSLSQRIQIIPQHQKHRITGFLNASNVQRLTSNNRAFLPLRISKFHGHQRAFVKIQDGCDNLCAYCKVPLVRGDSRSRSLKEIVAEARRLIGSGFKELVLSGVCLGDYHYRDFTLMDVLANLERLPGAFRLRLSSIEPQLVSDSLIAKLTGSTKLCPHLHIPLQSGDNTVLKRMNRKYTQQEYLSLIAKIKKKIKDVAVTTDVLVGFPGEDQSNFHQTIRCLKEILPLRTHIFSFSPRPGTAAFNLSGCLAPQLIKQRVNLLREIASECSYKFRKKFLGKQLTVLVESQSDKKSGFFCGYSENYIRTIIENATEKDVNKLVPVEVNKVNIYSTKAKRQ